MGKRAVLNTTIDKKTLDEFREYCGELGCSMGFALETFMKQIVKEKLAFKFGTNLKRIEGELEEFN